MIRGRHLILSGWRWLYEPQVGVAQAASGVGISHRAGRYRPGTHFRRRVVVVDVWKGSCCGDGTLSSPGRAGPPTPRLRLRPTIIVPENRKERRLCGVETHTRLWLLSFCSTEAGWHFTATIPRLTRHGSPPNLESACSINLRAVAATFEGRRWSVSRGLAWDVGA